MTAVALAPSAAAPPEGRIVNAGRRRGLAVFLVALAVLMFLGFGMTTPAHEQGTFLLTAHPSIKVSPLTMSVRWVSIALAICCAAVGVALYTWRRKGGVYPLFSIGVLLFLWDFLVWAARGQQLNFTALLVGTVLYSTPLVFGSLSGIMCERAAVINIAIEGQFLAGAFLGAMIGSYTHDNWLGLLCAAAAGGAFGALLAFLALRYGADQIIVGVVIVAFSTGLTNYLVTQVLTPYQATLNSPTPFRSWAIPLLSKIPIIGPALFDQNLFVYLAAVLVVVVNVALFRTRWGLRVRAVGEHPRAAETVGLNVIRTRYSNVILGGVIAGIGGAAFTIGNLGEFNSEMTAGLGYVALAAMIFGRWRPWGALGAAVLFGFASDLQSFLQVLNIGIPSEFLSMAPYVLTILVVSGLVGQVRPPAADGKPYSRE